MTESIIKINKYIKKNFKKTRNTDIATVKFLQKFLDPDLDPDYDRNLIVSSSGHAPPFRRILRKSVEYSCIILLSANKQTNADENITSLAAVIRRYKFSITS